MGRLISFAAELSSNLVRGFELLEVDASRVADRESLAGVPSLAKDNCGELDLPSFRVVAVFIEDVLDESFSDLDPAGSSGSGAPLVGSVVVIRLVAQPTRSTGVRLAACKNASVSWNL